ncbi:MAG TPA: hypothetical protein VKA13_01545 [Gammaproteobacteria bacterium]|nr:hypothetical protein [Gammaproteobacteria bacterium]
MATTEQQPILLVNNDSNASEGVLHLQAYDKSDRIKRAAKAWVGFWILAVLSIPIIGAHLFLIPAFLIAGPVSAYRRYHALNTSEKATGECPVCHNQVTIPLEPKEHLDLWKYCPVCNKPLHLVDKDSAALSTGAQ